MMNDYQQTLQEEKNYLADTLSFLKKELDLKSGLLLSKKQKLIKARKDMWENTVHHAKDFAKLTEISQYRTEVDNQAASFAYHSKRVDRLQQVIDSPYFGRFDFIEEGHQVKEKIYIGLTTIMDPNTYQAYVYDWRAPISGIFYQYEPGLASYSAPDGKVNGEVLLKRQYKIKNSRLEYFFDSSIAINDEMLQEILSRNASPKMRNIVETIQKEQDLIIRDLENDLLIVQGVAGSGKTSIGLHRIAYLLYQGLNLNLHSNNLIIISPNTLFSKYISGVLPELGEENITQETFNDITSIVLENRFEPETREQQLESVFNSHYKNESDIRRESIAFKGSKTFVKILERLISHYSHKLIPIEDIYFEGKTLFTKHQLKNRFLNNKTGIPMAKQLRRLENLILEKVHPLQKRKLARLEQIVANSDGHELEIKPYSRLLSIKSSRPFFDRLYNFTRVDYLNLYKMLFLSKGLFKKLAKGLTLPDDIDIILAQTGKALIDEGLVNQNLKHEDFAPLLYLKLRLEGSDYFPDIRQVVIDEAQDYNPLHFEIFKLLFKNAKYTVLGDINQTLEKHANVSVYDDIIEILDKEKTVKLFLRKGYRSSYEINVFTRNLLGHENQLVPFERHEKEPLVEYRKNDRLIDLSILEEIENFIKNGLESVAIICKTQEEAEKVYSRLSRLNKIKLIDPKEGTIKKGVVILPSYMTKGLEFDAVIVYNASAEHYSTPIDKNLLYVACTRALHRLVIYYTGNKSPFLNFAN